MARRRAVPRGVIVLAVVASSGCGPQAPQEVVFDLRATGAGTVFDPDSLHAPAGSPVVLRVVNEGEIAHNLVVVLDEDAVQPIVLAAYTSIQTEYVPTGFEEQIIASLPLVYPGQSQEVSFTMPEPGRYTYVCVFPGHGSTMRGTLISMEQAE